jgi:hypothetical protein
MGIGKSHRNYFLWGWPQALLLPFWLMGHALWAQDIAFQATAPSVVSQGERFRLTYTLNAEGKNFQSPTAIEGFQVLSGPTVSSNSSIQIINGKISQSVGMSFTYVLQATQEGRFSIPPAQITVNGKTYTSNTVAIEVIANPTYSQQPNNSNQPNNATANAISGNDLFAAIELSKTSVYQNEPVVATLKIYTRVDLAGFEGMKFPAFNGFWSEDIETASQITLERANVNGTLYNVGVLKKMLLFPQKNGKLTIDPMEIDCVVRQRVRGRSADPFSMFDDFFGGNLQNTVQKVISQPVVVQVKALPEPKPEGFQGAVGNFSWETSLDRSATKANEAITLKVKISGQGNLKLVEAPKIPPPPDFEVYDPKVSQQLRTGDFGMNGSKTFEYLVIPRYHGDFSIPVPGFSFFNPATQKYETLQAQPLAVNVERGELADVAGSQPVVYEPVNQKGLDIRYLKTNPISFVQPGTFLMRSPWFLAGYVLPLLLLAGVVFKLKEQKKLESDVAGYRNKQAAKMAKKRLAKAAELMQQGNKTAFYREILLAIQGYCSDKLHIPQAALNKEIVLEAFRALQVDDASLKQLMETMECCEMAQFAPAMATDLPEDLYQKTLSLLQVLDARVSSKQKVKA